MKAKTILAVLALVALGCGDEASREAAPAPVVATSGATTIRAGDAVPAPVGATILRVRGVLDGNDGTSTAFDLSTLERLPQVDVSIHEPFQKRDMTFRGVPLAELLRIAGVRGDDPDVYLHALDDYHVEFGLKGLEDAGAVLATRADGKRIRLEDGGPIRVVFPSVSDGPGKNKDNWIWSVDWIRVTA